MKVYQPRQWISNPVRDAYRRTVRLGLVFVLMTVGVCGCNANGDPGTDSTTHFWKDCTSDSQCSNGACVCGRCSRECEADAECSTFDARCVGIAEVLACEVNVRACVPTDSIARMHPTDLADASVSDEFVTQAPDGADASSALESVASGLSSIDASLEVPRGPVTSDATETATGTESPRGGAPVTTGVPTSETALGPGRESANEPASSSSAATDAAKDSNRTLTPTDDHQDMGLDVSPEMAQAYLAAPWWEWEPPPQVLAATSCALSSSSVVGYVVTSEWSCAERNYSVQCTDLGDHWSCICIPSGELPQPEYDVSGSSGQAACQAAFDACTNPDAEQCSTAVNKVDPAASCEWESTCVLAGDEGTPSVRRRPTRKGACFEHDNYAFCSCEGPNLIHTYIVRGAVADESCTLARASCESDQAPTKWTVGECQHAVDTDTPNRCTMRRECPASSTLSDQVTALTATTTYAGCSPNGDGSITCGCGHETGGLSWTYASDDEVSVATCMSVFGMCDRVAEIEFSGEPDCRGTTGIDYPSACSREQRCSQSGTVDGQQFAFETPITFACEQTDSGDWTCSCEAGQKDVRDIAISPDGETSVCEQGFSICRAELTFVMPPVPTPP